MQSRSLRRGRRYSLGDYLLKGSPPVESDWAARVVSNGGAMPSANTLAALRDFYTALVSGSLVNKMKSVNCFVPDGIIAAKTPFIQGLGGPMYTDYGTVSYVDADLAINGLKSDGTKALRVNLPMNTVFAGTANAGVSFHVSVCDNNAVRDMGGTAVTGDYSQGMFVHINLAGGNDYFTVDGNSTQINGVVGNVAGFRSGNRVSSSYEAIYFANTGNPIRVVASTVAAAAHNINAGDFGIWQAYNAGSGISTKRLSFFALHDGLSIDEANTLYNAVQAMRTAIGGGTV